MPTSAVGGPLPTVARQGRQKQRYGECGERLIAGCIPMRYTGEGEGVDGIEVLMVTRRSGDGWVFPKGGWEIDEETAEQAAKRETVEEAGVRGIIEEDGLGSYPFVTQKKGEEVEPKNGSCIAYMYVMRVQEVLDEWPEQEFRRRKWYSLTDACSICLHKWMRDALRLWLERHNWAVLSNGKEDSTNCGNSIKNSTNSNSQENGNHA